MKNFIILFCIYILTTKISEASPARVVYLDTSSITISVLMLDNGTLIRRVQDSCESYHSVGSEITETADQGIIILQSRFVNLDPKEQKRLQWSLEHMPGITGVKIEKEKKLKRP